MEWNSGRRLADFPYVHRITLLKLNLGLKCASFKRKFDYFLEKIKHKSVIFKFSKISGKNLFPKVKITIIIPNIVHLFKLIGL